MTGLSLLVSCKDYLDYKPNIKMAIPTTLEDAELLLSDYSTMNTGYPNQGEVSGDNYFLSKDNWFALQDIDDRNLYCWNSATLTNATAWQNAYKVVYIANQVIELLTKVDPKTEPDRYNRIQGTAHFFRAFAFHQLLANYSLAFDKSTAATELGVPLRLTPNIDEKLPRATLAASYSQVLADLMIAVEKLPANSPTKGIPSKAAAYAALARVYLDMADYEQAYRYADASLQLYDLLLDYSTLDPNEYLSFSRFNNEVLFPATAQFSEAMGEFYLYVDSTLYHGYEEGDRRKALFFKDSPSQPDYKTFKGSYDNTYGSPFIGLTTGEMLLVRAESAVRTHQLAQGRADINTLLTKRWEGGKYNAVDEQDADRLLRIILEERRKELIFRGLRWPDLKRLNKDSKFQVSLMRDFNGERYMLSPNSLNYGILLPQSAITVGGLIQNKR